MGDHRLCTKIHVPVSVDITTTTTITLSVLGGVCLFPIIGWHVHLVGGENCSVDILYFSLSFLYFTLCGEGRQDNATPRSTNTVSTK